jgi:hypothetical protein
VGNCGLEWNLSSVGGLSRVVLQQQVVVLVLDMQGLHVPANAKKIFEMNNFKKNLILADMEQSKSRSNLKRIVGISHNSTQKNSGNKKTRKEDAFCQPL